MYGILVFLLLVTGRSISFIQQLKIVAEWKTIDFAFPRPDMREKVIQNGNFIQENCVPIDVDVDYQVTSPSRIFVTIPRFTTGVPITLGYVTGLRNLIKAYPAFTWHNSHGSDCDGITSVFRITVSFVTMYHLN